GNLGSLGDNLIGNAQDGSGFQKTDLRNVDPLLGPLQDNGGPTRTRALLAGSPAIDAGDPAFQPPPDTDQPGEGFAPVVGGRIDIGAFEVQVSIPVASFAVAPDYAVETAGVPFDVSVSALDDSGQVVPTYTGRVQFWTSDRFGQHPYQYTFRAADRGVA